MKKFLFFILFANFLSAQNPDLLNTDWHITKIVSELISSDLNPPPMIYNQVTNFSTTTPQLNLTFFNTVTADLTYVGQDGMNYTNKNCTTASYLLDNGEVNQFFGLICDFFVAPIVYYSIQQSGNQKILIIANAIFGELHFISGVLSTNENDVSQVVLAPNPVEDILIIKNLIPVNSYKIFDQSGELIDEKMNINTRSLKIDIQNYQTGVYFIKLNDDNSIKFIKK